MNEEVLLTSEAFVKSQMSISDNVAGKYILPSIREAQDDGLREILGDNLYEAIKQKYADDARNAGHDGMDYMVLRAFFEAVEKKAQFPIDVYDAASWMCITALSEQSIAMGGAPVAIPDFTGFW